MNGNDLSALDKDGNAIWVIGWGIGKPTHENNKLESRQGALYG